MDADIAYLVQTNPQERFHRVTLNKINPNQLKQEHVCCQKTICSHFLNRHELLQHDSYLV